MSRYKLYYREGDKNYRIVLGKSASSLFSRSRLVLWIQKQDRLPPLYNDWQKLPIRAFDAILEFETLDELKNYFMECLI